MAPTQETQRPLQGSQQQRTQQGATGRELRGQYRSLFHHVVRNDEDLVSLDSKHALAAALEKANALQGQVQRPREQAVDSEVFAHLTDRGVELAKKLAHGSKGHTLKEFVRRLRARYVHAEHRGEDGDEHASDPSMFDWAALGATVAGHFKGAPAVFCMVGPMEAQAKVRRAAVRQPKQRLAEEVRPQEIQDGAEQAPQETVENAVEMWGILSRRSVPLLELVLNCLDFAQTVENIFALSFLVKDGKVEIYKADSGQTEVRAVSATEEAASTGHKHRAQMVIVQDRETWEQWKQYVRPEDCLMRHRGNRGAAARATGSSAAAKRTASPANEKERQATGKAQKQARHCDLP